MNTYSTRDFYKATYLVARGVPLIVCAELFMSIYPGLSQFWHGREKDFTPEVEKKLLVADESTSDTEAQYRMLKKYSGQDKAVVNKKYMAEYTALNNLNIIILSNSSRPIHVDQTALPTDEMNNQFFVHKMKPITGPIDTQLPAKLQYYLGHYLRTELLSVFTQIRAKTDCRYSIPVPITDAERELFDLNKSDLDEEVDKLLDRIVGRSGKMYEEFFKDGYIPKKFISDYYYPRGMTKVDVYRRLKELGWCEPSDSSKAESRPRYGGQQERSLTMTQKMKNWYAEQKKDPDSGSKDSQSQNEPKSQTEIDFVTGSDSAKSANAA